MKNHKNNFAKNLRKYRQLKGLSQNDFASMIPIHRTSIVKYESGRSYPSVEIIYRIVKILEIDFNTLFE